MRQWKEVIWAHKNILIYSDLDLPLKKHLFSGTRITSFLSESLPWNPFHAGGCTNATAGRIGTNNSVQSGWWYSKQSKVRAEWTPSIKRWRFSGTWNGKFLFLYTFSVALHFLNHADVGQIMLDSPWTLNFLYFKNIKTCCWIKPKLVSIPSYFFRLQCFL